MMWAEENLTCTLIFHLLYENQLELICGCMPPPISHATSCDFFAMYTHNRVSNHLFTCMHVHDRDLQCEQYGGMKGECVASL